MDPTATAPGRPDKAEAFRLLRASIEADLSLIVSTHKTTTAGAVHAESRAENDKDTRALESTYLARGLAQRASELSEARAKLAVFSPRRFAADAAAALGALVKVENEDTEEARWYLLAPAGGGLRLDVDGVDVAIVTPGSPIGDALIGKRADDDFELRTRSGLHSYRVVEIR